MLELAALIIAVVGVIFAATSHGSILGKLWQALKTRFGPSVCRSLASLKALGRERLRNDLHQMLSLDAGLRSAVEQHHSRQTQAPLTIDGYDQYDEYDEYDEW